MNFQKGFTTEKRFFEKKEREDKHLTFTVTSFSSSEKQRLNDGQTWWMSGNNSSEKYSQSHQSNFYFHTFDPLPDENFLDWSKLKQTADNILKCI